MNRWMLKLGLLWLLIVAVIALAMSLPAARAPDEPPPLPKSDRIVVQTIQYVPPTPTVASRFADFAEPTVVPLPPAKPTLTQDESPAVRAPKRQRAARRTSDGFCARYGMHKVVTRGGKSWRCRKG